MSAKNPASGLNNQLKLERARHNLTQQELADLVGVTRKTINTVENGRFIPSTILALKLARALHTRVDELFSLAETDEAGPRSLLSDGGRQPGAVGSSVERGSIQRTPR